MKFLNQAKRFGAVVLGAAVTAPAFAASQFDTITAAVDLTGVATWVGTIGVLIVGIAMAFKGVDLSKRGIRKA